MIRHSSYAILAGFLSVAILASAQSAAPAQNNEKSTTAQSTAQNSGGAAAPWRQIPTPPLPPFHPQEPKRIQLPNGMIVFLQEDHELPLLNGTAYIRGGSRDDPAAKAGLTDVYSAVWRTGGTKSQTGDQMDDQLEARAAKVESGAGVATTRVSFSCLKGDFDFVFNAFNDVLRNPEFRQEKIELAKDNLRTEISRRNDEASEIAARESTKIGYGAESPYAREPEYATVDAITRQDLLDWHSKYVHPNNIILGIVGDFDSAAMEKKLRATFANWPKGPAYTAPQIPITDPTPGVYFVEKDDVNQSDIRMVALGIRRDNPDYFAVQVMNEIFGGGFASRLFKNLRTKAGLAYDVGGGIGSAFDHKGLTRLEMGTKSTTTVEAIQGMYKEVDDMRTDPVSATELQQGKGAILNSFIFNFDTPEKVLLERMTYELYGYPADFLERYRKGIEATSAADVDRVAKKYLDRSKLAVLVVGRSADFDKPISTLGQVKNIDIAIPPPPEASGSASKPSASGKASAAPAASDAQGKALLAKVIESSGGAQKLSSIKAAHRKATIALKQSGVQIESDSIEVVPDKVHLQVQTPNGELTLVSAPQASYIQFPMGVQPLPPGQRDDLLKEMQRNVWFIAQHASDPKYGFSDGGVEQVGSLHASVLNIHTDMQQLRWYIDPRTGHILRAQFQATTQAGPANRVVDYSEWKTVDGVTLPFHEETADNGSPSASVSINSVEFNVPVDNKIFEKPAGGKQ